jgi:MSHA biogenesis protein MshM
VIYLAHFGLREPPFSLTPDTDFFFARGTYQEALNVLLVALRSGEGFIKVTGEVGTGKTLLCRTLLRSLGPSFATTYIPNPFLSPTGLLAALGDELALGQARSAGQHRLVKAISQRLMDHHAQGRRVVLLLDEAQAIPRESLEVLRLLTNLETEKRKLLQVVLFGQPELEERLAAPAVRQLRQRITFAYHLGTLPREDLQAYLAHRLQVAGYGGASPFSPNAVRALQRASGGVPRLVNILAHKALMAAYGQGRRGVSAGT